MLKRSHVQPVSQFLNGGMGCLENRLVPFKPHRHNHHGCRTGGFWGCKMLARNLWVIYKTVDVITGVSINQSYIVIYIYIYIRYKNCSIKTYKRESIDNCYQTYIGIGVSINREYPNGWIVYIVHGKSKNKMDDLRVPPWLRKPPYWLMGIKHYQNWQQDRSSSGLMVINTKHLAAESIVCKLQTHFHDLPCGDIISIHAWDVP